MVFFDKEERDCERCLLCTNGSHCVSLDSPQSEFFFLIGAGRDVSRQREGQMDDSCYLNILIFFPAILPFNLCPSLSLSLSLSLTHTHMHKVKFPQKIPHFVSQDFFSDFHLIVCWSVFPFLISTSSVPPSRRPY